MEGASGASTQPKQEPQQQAPQPQQFAYPQQPAAYPPNQNDMYNQAPQQPGYAPPPQQQGQQPPPPQGYYPPGQGPPPNAAPYYQQQQPPQQGQPLSQPGQPPQPYQKGAPGQAPAPYPPGGQPAYHDNLANVEKTIADMQQRGMYNDPRYHQMVALAQRLRQPPGVGGEAEAAGPPAVTPADKVTMSESEQAQFDAQVQAYRTMARQLPIPVPLAQKAMRDPNRPPASLLPEPYAVPGTTKDGAQLPYNLMNILELHKQRAQRVTTVPKPTGIDPQTIIAERENRIANRMGERISELESVRAAVGGPVRTKVEIELRSLKLFNLQKQLRGEIVSLMRRDTTLETALNPNAYRRTKKQSLREARVTEKLEKQQKMAAEKKRRERHREFLDAVLAHAREFKEHHKNNIIKATRVRRAVTTHHQNAEKERRKDEEKREKDRMQKLMQEDEEGYRELLDKKKDRRLVYLLEQTDEYVAGLTNLLSGHQQTTDKVKKDERRRAREQRRIEREETRRLAAESMGENSNLSTSMIDVMDSNDGLRRLHVRVKCTKTGGVLHGRDAPTADKLEEWMLSNPGYEIMARDGDSSSESDDSDAPTKKHASPEKASDPTTDGPTEMLTEEDEKKKLEEVLEKARAEEHDDEYTRKQKQEAADEASYYMTAHAKQEIIEKQPSIMVGGQLKPYQIKGLEWLVSLYNNNLNGILADEMGLGKTIQTIALITHLMEHKRNAGPFLIIVPLSTISNWDMEFDKWGPTAVKVTYKGPPQTRKVHHHIIKSGRFNVLLTTYDYIIKDKAILSKIHWKYMIIDEGHRMKNHHNKLTTTLNAYYTAPHRLLLTGTPLQNKLPELWALLNFLLPSIFKSCDTFEQWFNAPFATTGEKVELNGEESMLVIRRLHKVLRPFLLRRLKKEVESQLPDKTEYLLKCDMSALQKILYESLKEGLLVSGNAQGMKSVMNTVMQLRKLCNHPFLFHEVESMCRKHWKMDAPGSSITGQQLVRSAGKFDLLDRILPKLKATGHRVLMFCQMTQLMTILEDFMGYRGYKYLRLDGSTNHDERGEMLKAYNAPGSEYFIFLLSTRAGGLGLNLQTADTVIIYDSDWNPHQDLQAQDRAHRIGQSKEVRVLRLMTVNSIEERILAAARSKLNMDSKVIQAGMFDNKSTGSDRKKFLENILTNERDDDDEENEVPDDDQINEMLARSDDELEAFGKMDLDRRRAEADATKGLTKLPRLIAFNEVPQAIVDQGEIAKKMAAGTMEYEDDKKAFGQGKRQRKDVNYGADIMSEREWLNKFTDETVEDDEILEDETSESIMKKTPSASSRKRRAEEAADYGESSMLAESTPTPKRGRGRKPAVLGDSKAVEDCNKAYNVVTNFKSSDDRVIAEPFMLLPTRRELPDYYERIDQPMDFKKIKKKIDGAKYRSLDAMGEDVHLLCNNAQEYNIDESLIHQDSKLLKATWDMIRKRFADMENASKAPPPAAEPVVPQPAPVPQQQQQQAPPTVAPSAMAPPVLAPSVVTEAAAPMTDALDLSVNK